MKNILITLLVILVNRSGLILAYNAEHWIIRACAAVTIWSAIHYLWLAANRLRGSKSLIESPQ